MTLGEKIQVLRKQQGMSQEQLGALMTVSRQAISKWEVGESVPDVDNVVQLSDIFNVTTDYLLKNGSSMEISPSRIIPDLALSTTIEEKYTVDSVSETSSCGRKSSPKSIGRTMVISGIIGMVMAGIPGVLYRMTSDILFPLTLIVILIGALIIFSQSFGKTSVPTISIYGAKLTCICIAVICVTGIPGFLRPNHADLLLYLSFFVAIIGIVFVIYGYARPFIEKRNKAADMQDLRPSKPVERDATEWKN